MQHKEDVNQAAEAQPAGGASEKPLTIMQARLQGKKGKLFWQSFEQLADTPEMKTWIEDEFPNRQTLFQVDRRNFLKIGGAALAMAGLTGCRILPQEKAVPYVRAPEEVIPGLPLFYTTALTRSGYAIGVMVESHEGRPTKVEGNPNHPASLGATDVFEQAEVLNLYDPERVQSVVYGGDPTSWDRFVEVIRETLTKSGGDGLRLLTETITSPTLAAQIQKLIARYPGTKWHRYEPVGRENVYEGANIAFGQPLTPVYRLKKAQVIVSLDGDFLKTLPGNVRYARDFADGRRVRAASAKMNRLYAFDSTYSITGLSADHRFPIKPSEVDALARALYGKVTGQGTDAPPPSVKPEVLDAIVADLKANSGAAVVIPGDEASPAVHALAMAINSALNAIGQTVDYIKPVEANTENGADSLKALTDDINAGQVKTLVILGGNPVYTAPVDIKFAEAMVDKSGKKRVPLIVRLGRYDDETSAYADWLIAESHPLECWSDALAYDGTASIIQPLIQPLYDTRSAHDLIATMLMEPQDGYDIIRGTYQASYQNTGALAFDKWFETVLYNGVVPNSAFPPVTGLTAAADILTKVPAPAASGDSLELNMLRDPHLWDGRYSNNSWLQEMPKPITTITWDNAAIISPATAKKIGLLDAGNKLSIEETDAVNVARASGKRVIAVKVGDTSVNMPVYILPGHPDDVITAHLGFGRTRAGNVGNDHGFNVYTLRDSKNLSYIPGVNVTVTGQEYDLAYTQSHHLLHGIKEDQRDIVHAGSLDEFISKKGEMYEEAAKEAAPETNDAPNQGTADSQGNDYPADPYRKMWRYADKSQSNKEGYPSLYPEYSGKDYNQWAMNVDMTVCTGCNACVIACQSENNIPTVGKDQIGRGRQMHWIRIDHYFSGDNLTNVDSHLMPMFCQQCEKAPCEPVCPVAATIHSHEGLNQMVYNRCIGTRYCSNNCPYKVRRFNFLKWVAGIGGKTTLNYDLPVLKNLANPDVTVRGRGVMEKCMYCVQRINAARIKAKKEFREIGDGEIVTACQQACPTRVFTFGDINDPNSQVSKLRSEPHNYSVLAELNTRPRTTYLAKIRNTNSDIEKLLDEPAGAKA